MKKLATFVLATVLCLSMFTACGRPPEYVETIDTKKLSAEGTYPIVKDEYKGTIKYKMMGWSHYTMDIDWKNNLFFQRMKELTGIDFDFEIYSDAVYGEKKPLAFASKETMPDFLFKALIDPQEEVKYGSQKLIIPLENYIEACAPNLRKLLSENPEIKKSITAPDGHIYTLPTLNAENDYNFVGMPWINKEWLKNVGLEMPTTPAEFKAMLKAFKTQDANGNGDPNDEIPMMIAGEYELSFLFSFFGIDDFVGAQINKDDKVELVQSTQRYKDALAFFADLYNEGLLPKNYSTTTIQQLWSTAKENGGNKVGFFVDYAPYAVVGNANAHNYAVLDTVKNDYYGNPIWAGQKPAIGRGMFAVTQVCKDVEVLIRWIDTLYSDEYNIWAEIGKEGVEWAWTDETKTEWEYIIPEEDRTQYMSKAIVESGGCLPYKKISYDFMSKTAVPQIKHTLIEAEKLQDIGYAGFPQIFFKDAKTIKQVSVMYADISKYLNEMRSAIISGKKTVEQGYSNFDTTMKKMSLDGYLRIYSQAYDAYKV